MKLDHIKRAVEWLQFRNKTPNLTTKAEHALSQLDTLFHRINPVLLAAEQRFSEEGFDDEFNACRQLQQDIRDFLNMESRNET